MAEAEDDIPTDRQVLFDLLFSLLQEGNLNEDTLIQAFCKGDDSEEIFEKLKNDDAGCACGKVFTRGDYAYQCRTCQSDDTCIICVDCFNDSDHVGHEVRMTFAHGGCCDCGDLESWKLEGTCSQHRPVETIPDFPDTCEESVIEFIIYVLSSAFSGVNNIHFLNPRANQDGEILVKWRKKQEDFNLVRAVCKCFGNLPIEVYIRGMCMETAPLCRASNITWKKVGRFKQVLIAEKITASHLFITDAMRSLLFSFLDKVAGLHISIKKSIGDQLRKSLKELNVTLSVEHGDREYLANDSACLHYWVRDDLSLPKSFRRDKMEPLLFKIFAIPEFKEFFGRVFVQNYYELIKIWCDLPDNLVEIYSTIFSLGVQLFTIPGLVPKMLNEENFMNTLVESTKLTIQRNPGHIQRPLHDFQYVLEIPDILYVLITETNFLTQILDIAVLMQYDLPILRKTGTHIEQENEKWLDLLNAMNAVLRLVISQIAEPLDLMLQNAPTEQREILLQSALSVITKMTQYMQFPDPYNQPHDRPNLIAPYDLATSKVSIYTPVSKIISILLAKIMKYAPLKALDIASPMIEYVDMSIIQVALIDQARANLWIHNGNHPNKLVDCVGCWVFGQSLALPDLSGVQLGACYLDADIFLERMITRYGLNHLLIPDVRPNCGWPTFPPDKTQSLVSFFLKTLVHTVSALPFMDTKQAHRKFLLHWLASGEKNAQKLKSSLGKKSISDAEFSELLQEIGQKKISSGLRQVTFDLKHNQRKRFDPCFPWYIQLTDRADANANIKHMYEMKKEAFTWWPEIYPAVFAQARRILTSQRLSGIVRLVLWCCCEQNHVVVSKETLPDALALICFAIECCLCEQFSDEDRGKVVTWICGKAPFMFWSKDQLNNIVPAQQPAQQPNDNLMSIFQRVGNIRSIGGRAAANLNAMLQLGRETNPEEAASPDRGADFTNVSDPIPNKDETLLQLLNRLMKKQKNPQIALIFRKLAELCEKFDEPVLSAALFQDIGYVADNAKTAMKKAKKSKKKRKKAERARKKAQKMIQQMSAGFERRNKEALDDLATEEDQEKRNEERFGVGAKRACVICRSYENQEEMGQMVFIQPTRCVPIMLGLDTNGREASLSTCSHMIHTGCQKKHKKADEKHFLRRNESKCPLCGAVYNALVPSVTGVMPEPWLHRAYCNPSISLVDFFDFWDNFDLGKKHTSSVAPDVHNEFTQRLKKAIGKSGFRLSSKASRDFDSLLSALHYALKGDEALCRLTPPSQHKFYRLFSSLMSILVYHWDSFRTPSGTEFFWTEFWKRNGIPNVPEKMQEDEEEEVEAATADDHQDNLESGDLVTGALSPQASALVQNMQHLINTATFAHIVSEEDESDSLDMEKEGNLPRPDQTGLFDVDACESLLRSVLAYPQSFYFEDEKTMDTDLILGYAFIVTSIEKDGEELADKEIVVTSNGEPLGTAKAGGFVQIPAGAEDLKVGISEGISPVKLEFNDHYAILQEDCDLYYRIRRPPSPQAEALHRMLQSCYIIHILQCLLNSGTSDEMDKLDDVDESYCILDIFQRVHDSFDQKTLENLLLPFLRYASVLWHGLGLIHVPPDDIWPGKVEQLLSTLSLPPYMSILAGQTHPRLSKLFLKYVDSESLPNIDCNELPSLTPLPSSYSEIFQEVSNASESKEELSICLFCDQRVQLPSKESMKYPVIRRHVKDCAGYCGMFLRTRKREATQILISKRANMAHASSPYVDSFGCTDHGLYRGKLLSLDERRYKYLTEIAISRDIQNFVLRNIQPRQFWPLARLMGEDDSDDV